ncbi:MAG: hypothetical protein HZC47_00875 [Methanobacterium sp.]|uniref:hypothetical protein n=1 Tax=Methanobacterium sp. TaxID=2164 RepID=UPI003D65F971|nr:hypothetical protein [Methanobacterium sp.]
MDLKPTIWISTIDHLELYNEIIKSGTFKNKFFYNYPAPEDFPKTNKLPLTYFSSGEVIFKGNELLYRSIEVEKNSFKKYVMGSQYNLIKLSFILKPSNIKSIEQYSYKNPSNKRKWNWIRVICDEDMMDGDFLISVDGKSNTKKLFEMLNQFKENQTVSVSLNDLSDSAIPMLGYIGLFLLLISSVLDLIVTATYGTINGNIGGPIVAGLLLLAMILIFTSMIWYLTKINENSKIQYHWQLFLGILFIYIMLNAVKNLFYS